jgi:hypothetical protein
MIVFFSGFETNDTILIVSQLETQIARESPKGVPIQDATKKYY